MRLVWLELEGYRRFRGRTKTNTDGRVVAYVGPNEAGKSTFLLALAHLNHEKPFDVGEISRGASPPDNTVMIRATFLLEDGDLSELSLAPSASPPRWFTVMKLASGSMRTKLQPPLSRDLKPRTGALKAMQRAASSKWLGKLSGDMLDALEKHEGLIAEAAARGETLHPLSYRKGLETDVLEALKSEEQSLNDADIEALNALAEAWSDASVASARNLATRLKNLAAIEAETHPDLAARRALKGRSPEFLLFTEEDRSLASDYSLTELESWPTALKNLADLAGLDLSVYRDAILRKDYGAAETMTQAANDRLTKTFAEAWKQSKLTVRIRDDESILRILISDEGNAYTSIAERSDGLRTFVALVAFTSGRPHEHPPVLLLDEAEAHLHYDAQADLVRVLTKQQSASQVIYTTHSAGCLPQDLGTGVRVIAPIEGATSEFRDAFWSEGPGFSPLLIGMGASTFALAMRGRAVIAEGVSEVILLPTLLREVSGKEDLGFQVAPGLAEVNKEAVQDLQLEAPRVAYVVDGDEAGRAIKRKLTTGGVPVELVIQLGGGSQEIVLEDTINKVVYAEAINEELTRSHGSAHRIDPNDLPANRRPSFVTSWCTDRGIEPPSRRSVALRIVERRRNGPLVAPEGKRVLKNLERALEKALGFDPNINR